MSEANEAYVTDTIAAVLRADGSRDASRVTSLEPDLLVGAAIEHGVASLLLERLSEQGEDAAPAVDRLREPVRLGAIWELKHKQVLGTILERFAKAGIEPILLKGTALAYSLYGKPLLRLRGDTDLLVRDDQKEEAAALLTANAFERRQKPSGQFISYQDSYCLIAHDSTGHVIDLHWRPINAARLADVFSYDELLQRAAPLPQLSPAAKRAGHVDALLIACLHRLTHITHPYFVGDAARFDSDRLIWLYDIHLLAQAIEPDDWKTAARLAHEKGIGSILLNGLESAHSRFHTAYPRWVAEHLASADAEPLDAHIRSGPVTQYVDTLKTMDSLGDKARFLRELLLPPSEYMRKGYDGGRGGWIPWLYARRVVRGGIGKLKQERSRRRSEQQHRLVARRSERE